MELAKMAGFFLLSKLSEQSIGLGSWQREREKKKSLPGLGCLVCCELSANSQCCSNGQQSHCVEPTQRETALLGIQA